MSFPSDVYGSLDGLVHRTIDRAGKRLDAIRPRLRSEVGLGLSAVAPIQALGVLQVIPIPEYPWHEATSVLAGGAFMLLEGHAALSESMDRHAHRRRRKEPYQRVSQALRSVALTPALAGGLYATSGLVGVIGGALQGSIDAEDVHRISIGTYLALPAVSSYLRDRNPPAFEQDPLRKYAPKKAPKPAIEPRN